MSGRSTPNMRSSEISSITYDIQGKRTSSQHPGFDAETKSPAANTPIAVSKHARNVRPMNMRTQSRTTNRIMKTTPDTKGLKVGGISKSRSVLSTMNSERLAKEFRDVKVSALSQMRDLKLIGDNLFHWSFLLLPSMAPFNRAAFRAEIKFPETYPQQPPIITIPDMYHPNVDKNGFVCLHCLAHWARTTKMEDVLCKLFSLIKDPEPHHPMRFEVADEYLKDRELYMRKATEYARLHGLQRPR